MHCVRIIYYVTCTIIVVPAITSFRTWQLYIMLIGTNRHKLLPHGPGVSQILMVPRWFLHLAIGRDRITDAQLAQCRVSDEGQDGPFTCLVHVRLTQCGVPNEGQDFSTGHRVCMDKTSKIALQPQCSNNPGSEVSWCLFDSHLHSDTTSNIPETAMVRSNNCKVTFLGFQVVLAYRWGVKGGILVRCSRSIYGSSYHVY